MPLVLWGSAVLAKTTTWCLVRAHVTTSMSTELPPTATRCRCPWRPRSRSSTAAGAGAGHSASCRALSCPPSSRVSHPDGGGGARGGRVPRAISRAGTPPARPLSPALSPPYRRCLRVAQSLVSAGLWRPGTPTSARPLGRARRAALPGRGSPGRARGGLRSCCRRRSLHQRALAAAPVVYATGPQRVGCGGAWSGDREPRDPGTHALRVAPEGRLPDADGAQFWRRRLRPPGYAHANANQIADHLRNTGRPAGNPGRRRPR
jgi:hypothetical protein